VDKVLKAIVVDDMAVARRFLEKVLAKVSGVEVVGTASNGEEALQLIESCQPDVVFLDIEMPVMDGIEALSAIKRDFPEIAVLMVSSVTDAGRTMEALRLGAIDFIPKPEAASDAEVVLRGQFGRALRIVASQRRKRKRDAGTSGRSARPAKVAPIAPDATPRGPAGHDSRLIVIGVSTGGPCALEQLIPALGNSIDCPVLIVQHMPKGFTESLAQSLDRKSNLTVTEAKDGDPLAPGCVLLAPGGLHMEIKKARGRDGLYSVQLMDTPAVNECRPSVDVLFESISKDFEGQVLATILTGMGTDGRRGVQGLRKKGTYVLAQDEESCVVYGMPRAIVEAGLADEILSLDGISQRIIEFSSDASAVSR
jgi:two-component system chemotaxis response regulator CheB